MIRTKFNNKIRFSDTVVLLIFIILPFIISGVSEDTADLLHLQMIPSFVSLNASLLRWFLFIVITLYAILHNRKLLSTKGSIIAYMLSFFYVIQFLYAIASKSDIIRYLGLSIISFSLPVVLGYFLIRSKINILQTIRYIIYLQIILNLIVGMNSLFMGYRFQGVINNPNLFGLIALFWLTILMLPTDSSKKHTVLNYLFVFFNIITIIASGSRASFVGLIIISFAFLSTNKINRNLIIIILFFTGFIITSYFIDIPFIDRLEKIGLEDVDSGRRIYWDTAVFYIKNNLWFGYGMDAPMKLVDTGNIHNCYLRYLLMIGLFFTIISFLFYFLFIIQIWRTRKNVPSVLIGFILAFTVMNFAEDYYVGIGSSAFLSFLVIVGFVIYYLNQPNKINNK